LDSDNTKVKRITREGKKRASPKEVCSTIDDSPVIITTIIEDA
jgi:hypothetical protein